MQSGRRATRAVSNWEGPCGASVGVFGREPSFGVDGVGVTALPRCQLAVKTKEKRRHTCPLPLLRSPVSLTYH